MDSRLLSGTVDMLIMDVLSRGDSYGYQIAQSVLAQSDGYFELKEGSLYPALHRLERQGWCKSYWVLTPKGRRALESKRDDWSRFAGAVNGVLGANHALA